MGEGGVCTGPSRCARGTWRNTGGTEEPGKHCEQGRGCASRRDRFFNGQGLCAEEQPNPFILLDAPPNKLSQKVYTVETNFSGVCAFDQIFMNHVDSCYRSRMADSGHSKTRKQQVKGLGHNSAVPTAKAAPDRQEKRDTAGFQHTITSAPQNLHVFGDLICLSHVMRYYFLNFFF